MNNSSPVYTYEEAANDSGSILIEDFDGVLRYNKCLSGQRSIEMPVFVQFSGTNGARFPIMPGEIITVPIGVEKTSLTLIWEGAEEAAYSGAGAVVDDVAAADAIVYFSQYRASDVAIGI